MSEAKLCTALYHTPAVIDVLHERRNQDKKWGEQNHDYFLWLAILTEEVGEASQEALRMYFDVENEPTHRNNLRKELVQVAAVALAMVECMDRQETK